MKYHLTSILLIGALFVACNVPPEEPAASGLQESGALVANSDNQSEPAATAEIVLGAQQANTESYPAPEQLAVGDYPEPEVVVVADYPESDEVVDEVAADQQALSAAPDITGEGDVEVVFVSARMSDDGSWNFSVTLEHEDTGWEDYADGWDVLLSDGTVLKPNPDVPFTRLLVHPHENEQPFTRAQSNIVVPAGVSTVYVRAHELVEGYSDNFVTVDLTVPSGDRFEVSR